MAKLTDEQEKRIIAEYVEGGTSHRKLAAKYGVSTYKIASVLHSDREINRKISQKKEENDVKVLQHMESRAGEVCGLVDRILEEMGSPEKLETASLNQLATAFGILIDKFTGIERGQGDPAVLTKAKELLEGINSAID